MAKRILIVDDSASIRQLVSISLKAAGYETETAENGKQALAKLSTGKFNLIICDVNMPEMNGLEFLTAIKNDPQYEEARFIPVIMLTTESSEDMKMKGQMQGAKAWIVKPFAPELMLKAVSKLCPE
ncbi:MAG: response regulator [Leptonema illini]|jgi:two-component system chemotaxis response regulator CheY|uniref:Response regulator receiver protein n=2 Tax=Leptonema illini TaxID=183 RepID=H2CGA6_9LEPT|nr:response regulator [Leptonema illini]EHQ05787.1 response regulator receiver protein [Leptonema illini DSM 21528]KAB2929979.1 MAG: response regulator [Leptonema illini]PKL33493.1 MAG: response regulator [Spirochaetae bacterium HGW-Spirochaetae-10]